MHRCGAACAPATHSMAAAAAAGDDDVFLFPMPLPHHTPQIALGLGTGIGLSKSVPLLSEGGHGLGRSKAYWYNVSFWLEHTHYGDEVARGLRPRSVSPGGRLRPDSAKVATVSRPPLHRTAACQRRRSQPASSGAGGGGPMAVAVAADPEDEARRQLFEVRSLLLPGAGLRRPGTTTSVSAGARAADRLRKDSMPLRWDSDGPIRDRAAQPRSPRRSSRRAAGTAGRACRRRPATRGSRSR